MADCIPIPRGGNFQDLTEKTFGRLKVVGYQGKSRWKCLCECGKIQEQVDGNVLRRGHSKSCGCLHRERMKGTSFAKKHGMRSRPEYAVWLLMKQRCTNKNLNQYGDYGGRGITVCDRWMESFSEFISDVGFRPSSRHSIDRIDNSGNYCPENCRWSTRIEQQRNTRRNVILEFNGKSMCVAEWAEETGIARGTLQTRVRNGWNAERTLTTPVNRSYFTRLKNQKTKTDRISGQVATEFVANSHTR